MLTHNLNKKRIAVSVNLKLNALEKLDKKPSALKSYRTITGVKGTIEAPNNKTKSLQCRAGALRRLPTTEALAWMGWGGGDMLCWSLRSSCGPELKGWRRAHMSSSKDKPVGQWDSEGLLACPLTLQAWGPESGPRTQEREPIHSVVLSLPRVYCGVCMCSQCVGMCMCVFVHVWECTHR